MTMTVMHDGRSIRAKYIPDTFCDHRLGLGRLEVYANCKRVFSASRHHPVRSLPYIECSEIYLADLPSPRFHGQQTPRTRQLYRAVHLGGVCMCCLFDYRRWGSSGWLPLSLYPESSISRRSTTTVPFQRWGTLPYRVSE
jgi:hypothetical protein